MCMASMEDCQEQRDLSNAAKMKRYDIHCIGMAKALLLLVRLSSGKDWLVQY